MTTNNYLHASNSYMAIGIQTAWATAVAATVSQTVNEINLIQSIEGVGTVQTGYRRGIDAPITFNRGRYQVAGNTPGPLIPDEAYQAIFWGLLLGNSNTVSGDATTGYTHTFSEPDSNDATDWPGYISGAPGRAGATIEALKGGFADTASMFDYDSMFVSSVNIQVPENGQVIIDPTWIGRNETGGSAIGALSDYADLRTLYPFDDSHCQVQLGAAIGSVAAVEYKTASLTINTNPELVANAKNSSNPRYAVGLMYGKRSAAMSFTFDLREDMTIYNYFVNNTEIAAKLLMTHEELAGSSSGAYAQNFLLPRILMIGDPFTVQGDNNVEMTCNFQMMHDDTAGYGIQVVSVNSESGTYSV